VGSNIAPEANVESAMGALTRVVCIEAISTFFESEPYQRPGHPLFINGVWQIRTELPAPDLKFGVLREIERRMGRERESDRYAPRVIDLDLILYGDQVIEAPDLRIPDPDIKTRPFIAVPLVELAPDLVIPGSGEKLCEQPVVKKTDGLKALPAFTEQLKRQIET